MELRLTALQALTLSDPTHKVAAVAAAWHAREGLPLDPAAVYTAEEATLPGRPARPPLLPAQKVPSRTPFTPAGLAALLHAVCHIEFNAINLALDAVWRFAGLPRDYYLDWWHVAHEEAYHFTLLRTHLHQLGHDYGDFPAHNGLWSMCERTAHDALARMALVPRTLEARGLDATPIIQDKLRQVKSDAARTAVELLDIILRDEVGHVAIGNRWYRFLCEQRGLDPLAQYEHLVERHHAPRLRPPYNLDARRRAGFSEPELQALHALQAPQSQQVSQAQPAPRK
jgi:uncharacterized ferritin-like protein (DUF455 family)